MVAVFLCSMLPCGGLSLQLGEGFLLWMLSCGGQARKQGKGASEELLRKERDLEQQVESLKYVLQCPAEEETRMMLLTDDAALSLTI